MIRLDFELTPFIGRERERAQLESLLEEKRLVTIVGPGGTGKTRIAVEIASSRGDGVRFVDLSAVDDASSVTDEIAGEDASGKAARANLIVVDNCEHVLSAAGEGITALLTALPTAKVVATSREPLAIRGEAVMPLDPLPVPSEHAPLDEIRSSDSVRMFIDRARLSSPVFDVTASNATAIADLCRALDGLPLALELVAPYMRALTPADVLRRIRELGVEGVPEKRVASAARHATLRATIEWSYRLLSDEEQRCLSALGVFAGRFTLDAAREIAAVAGIDRDRAVDIIVSLVDKSLVRVQHTDDGAWYALLEMVRSFAWATLEDEPDDELHFDREGELWRIGRGRATSLLRDSKGLRYIRQLLDNPGTEIPAVALAAPGATIQSASMEAIDAEAKAAYRRRLEDLEEEVRTAEALEDDARLLRATEEREALASELARALGLGGRIRQQGAETERARMSVTKAIRGAIGKIAEHDEAFAAYLTAAIRTGAYCGYFPS